jgi:uncharacterized protein (TIGR02594 family)
MVQSVVAFRRSLRLVAMASCSMALFAIASPASAKPQNGAGRHAHAHHAGHHRHHYSRRHYRRIARASQAQGFADAQVNFAPNAAPGDTANYNGFGAPNVVTETRRSRRIARSSRWERGVARMQARGIANAQASVAPDASPAATATADSFSSSGVVAEARRYVGGNPTGRGRLWCARFMNMVLERSGHRGTGSDMARSFAGYGQRVSGPQVGAIAVMGRGRGGGHVGVVSGIDAQGNPIVVSGNNGNRVREAPVSRGRIYAYVMPN